MRKTLRLLSYAVTAAVVLGLLSAVVFLFVVRHQYGGTVEPRELPLGELEAYLEADSYVAGERVPVYVHTTSRATARLYRLGRTLQATDVELEIPATAQPAIYHPRDGLDWRPAGHLETAGLESGYYYLRLESAGGRLFCLPLILRPAAPPAVSVIASTNTWNAYNSWGGKSNYIDEVTPALLWRIARRFTSKGRRAFLARLLGAEPVADRPFLRTFLPFRRPYLLDDDGDGVPGDSSRDLAAVTDPREEHFSHLLRAEWPLVAFLEANGTDYGVYADHDLAFDHRLSSSKLWLFSVHSEYWSREMMGALERFLDSGGHVIFASGNNLYRQVAFYDRGIEVIRDVRRHEESKKAAVRLTGGFYNPSGYKTYAPYGVVAAEHWTFAGTGVERGEDFGAYSANRPPADGEAGAPTGASGWETDTLESGAFEILAVGRNPHGPAFMTIREDPSGGWIWNAASITFAGALQHDPVVDTVMRNLIDDALGSTQEPRSTPPAASASSTDSATRR